MRTFTYVYAGFLLSFFTAIGLHAAPVISVDAYEAKLGVFIDGKVKKARHTFKIKNIGNEALALQNVRPGCGCTAVGYDSIILPGKTGNVDAELDLRELHGGAFSKNIMVISNAKNKPQLKLVLTGIIQKTFEVTPSSIKISCEKGENSGGIVTIKTLENDFSVNEVIFKELDNPANWQEIRLPFSLTALGPAVTSKKNKDGTEVFFVFSLKILCAPETARELYGDIFIRTNLPDKPQINISGTLLTNN